MRRLAVILVAMVFILGFGFLTLSVVAKQKGISAASLLSFVVLLLLTVGVVGSLRDPPRR